MARFSKKFTALVVLLVAIGLAIGGLMFTKKFKWNFFQKDVPLGSLQKHQITLRIGYDQVGLGDNTVEWTKTAVEKNNQSARLEGLSDELNPEVLDLSKVEAFLGGLPKLPEGVLSQLSGRVLYLNAPELRLGMASAITAKNLKQGFSLVVPGVAQGGIVQATLQATVDKNLAQGLVSRAREATTQYNQEVGQLESKLTGADQKSASTAELLGALSLAKFNRFACAMVWRDNSQLLLETETGNNQFQDELTKAQQAASGYIMPSWVGMPGPKKL